MVRYLYLLDRSRYIVKRRQTMMQDILYLKKPQIHSVNAANCYICGRGLEDGFSVTAKKLPDGTVMFCDVHYSLQ